MHRPRFADKNIFTSSPSRLQQLRQAVVDGLASRRQRGGRRFVAVNRASLERLGRVRLCGLRIGASTVSIVKLLCNDWTGGISAGVA